jgi:hypothetical protein
MNYINVKGFKNLLRHNMKGMNKFLVFIKILHFQYDLISQTSYLTI